MKRIIFYILSFLLLVSPVQARDIGGDEIHLNGVGIEAETATYMGLNTGMTTAQIIAVNDNIRLIKYSTGITLASLTGKVSIAAPYLVTTSSVDLRPYALISGVQIVFNDGAKTATYTGNTPGSVETVGNNLVTSWPTSSGYETWTVSGGNITQAIDSGNDGISASNSMGLSAGALVFFTIDYTLTSGTGPTFRMFCPVNGSATGAIAQLLSTTGAKSFYATQPSSDSYIGFRSNGATNFSASNLLGKKVLTADTSGFNATACTAESGFNGNVASFIVTITKP